jgi:DNA polymerase family A/3'-5' exonuclease
MQINLGSLSCRFLPWKPANGRIFDRFSFDTETTPIDDAHPDQTPKYVIGAACDGERGVFIPRRHAQPFFEAHRGVPFVCHNATFDLRVTDVLLKPAGLDLYGAVERGEVWDTLILKRLLSLATTGNTARGQASLAVCCQEYLGVDLRKHQTDAAGNEVRTNFGQYLDKPPSAIPGEYLTYLAQDVIATWHLYHELQARINGVLAGSREVFGYVSDQWLQYAIKHFGPLTHHTQLKASIVVDALRANGIGIEQERRELKAQQVQALKDDTKERMRQKGYLVGEKGCDAAMQSILSTFKRKNPDVTLKRTESGQKWSTAESDLAELAAEDPFFADYAAYKTAEKLLSTYLRKMDLVRIHPKFGYLLNTGRTYCGEGFNLQNLPREKGQHSPAATIRGCFVPGVDKVFIDADFSQIELVVLGYAIENQFRCHSTLAKLVNGGKDVHRLIAANLLNKDAALVTKEERNSVKPVSFGRPGGMGPEGLRRVAKNGYGIDLTTAEVEQRINAYQALCPELGHFLNDEVNCGQVIADTLNLTRRLYNEALASLLTPRILPPTNLKPGWAGCC